MLARLFCISRGVLLRRVRHLTYLLFALTGAASLTDIADATTVQSYRVTGSSVFEELSHLNGPIPAFCPRHGFLIRQGPEETVHPWVTGVFSVVEVIAPWSAHDSLWRPLPLPAGAIFDKDSRYRRMSQRTLRF